MLSSASFPPGSGAPQRPPPSFMSASSESPQLTVSCATTMRRSEPSRFADASAGSSAASFTSAVRKNTRSLSLPMKNPRFAGSGDATFARAPPVDGMVYTSFGPLSTGS